MDSGVAGAPQSLPSEAAHGEPERQSVFIRTQCVLRERREAGSFF